MAQQYFTKQTIACLEALANNNNKPWFEQHREEYENKVRIPALDFISDMSFELIKISTHFLAIPKRSGGSLLRVHKDARFSKGKSPFKTNIGIQFRHELGRDIHAPGFYLHIEPSFCFIGVGLWRPEPDALYKIRTAISEKSEAWVKAVENEDFATRFMLDGDSLANAPRGFAKDHPMLDYLKRKDFIALAPLDITTVTSKTLMPTVVDRFKAATPFMQFLCSALDLQF